MDYSILSRSYDLRGIYGVDIDDEFFYRLGYAFAQVTQNKRIWCNDHRSLTGLFGYALLCHMSL